MNWAWSFRAFRLFRVDVRVHWSLLAVVLYYVVRGAQLGYSAATLTLFVILPTLLLFASVVAHEFGHVFAARHYSLRVDHMILTPIGGMVMVAQGRTPRHELVVALAGPLVNLALAAAGSALYFALGGPPSAGLLMPFLGEGIFAQLWSQQHLLTLVVFDFVQVQMGLFLFNIVLAAYPMDGGRILMAILWRRRGFERALVTSCKVGRVVAVLIGLTGILMMRPGLAAIGLMVFLQAHNTLARAGALAGAVYDPGFERALQKQAERRAGQGKRTRTPWSFTAWLRGRGERRAAALLAIAKTMGIDALTPSDRQWLKRRREV
jgi:stage IV sporulation protein FB